MTIGILKEFQIIEEEERNRRAQSQIIEKLKKYGAYIKIVSVPLVKYILPYHYSLIPSEAASNLARYDGIRYGHQPEFNKIDDDKSENSSDLFKYI